MSDDVDKKAIDDAVRSILGPSASYSWKLPDDHFDDWYWEKRMENEWTPERQARFEMMKKAKMNLYRQRFKEMDSKMWSVPEEDKGSAS